MCLRYSNICKIYKIKQTHTERAREDKFTRSSASSGKGHSKILTFGELGQGKLEKFLEKSYVLSFRSAIKNEQNLQQITRERSRETMRERSVNKNKKKSTASDN